MRQKLLQSKADRHEEMSQSLGCDSGSLALPEWRPRHELNRQKLMQGGDVRPMSLQPIDLDQDAPHAPLPGEGLQKVRLQNFRPQDGTRSTQSLSGIVTGDLEALSMNLR
mmetsp:Transcript_88533/g.140909  ORF Transcript_88533/g.140909 Transcript_88533/m.140909 type:complete len:110 (-) Transcript_88533:119-448(-)